MGLGVERYLATGGISVRYIARRDAKGLEDHLGEKRELRRRVKDGWSMTLEGREAPPGSTLSPCIHSRGDGA